MIFDTVGYLDSAWDASLVPVGNGTYEKAHFETWWDRNRARLSHLHPTIAEQWIYKHWVSSPYGHLPVERLLWRQENWATERILSEIYVRAQFGSLEPSFDYEVFHRKHFEPGLTMDRTGTWNYPIIILETPDGVKTLSAVDPGVRYCLIEGHQRFRYLNALSFRNESAAEHALFILTLGDTAAL
jgi:hypothetical protein